MLTLMFDGSVVVGRRCGTLCSSGFADAADAGGARVGGAAGDAAERAALYRGDDRQD